MRWLIRILSVSVLVGCTLPAFAGDFDLDVVPLPLTAGDSPTIVVTGMTTGCSEAPQLVELLRAATILILELDEPGCPILPPGPRPFRAFLTVDPLTAGDYNLELRDGGGHVLATSAFQVVGVAELSVRAAPRLASARDAVHLEILGDRETCEVGVSAIEINSESELSSVRVAIEDSCLLDPPPNKSPFALGIDLGRLPPGKYLVDVDQTKTELSARDYFEVGYSNNQPVFTIPELPTDRDATFELYVNLPGQRICDPLKRTLTTSIVLLEVDERCIAPAPADVRTTLVVELGALAAGRYPVVVHDSDSDELLRSEIVIAKGGDCEPSEATLCLGGGRFEVVALRRTSDDMFGPGHARQRSRDSGTFWFFDPENVELDVKVLDGCAINQSFWVFVAGLTHVGVDLRVTDTATGQAQRYVSRVGDVFSPIQHTSAFDCP